MGRKREHDGEKGAKEFRCRVSGKGTLKKVYDGKQCATSWGWERGENPGST